MYIANISIILLGTIRKRVGFSWHYLQRRAKRSSALRAKAAELARTDCKARKGGTKLRLATCSGTFWLNIQLKLI